MRNRGRPLNSTDVDNGDADDVVGDDGDDDNDGYDRNYEKE